MATIMMVGVQINWGIKKEDNWGMKKENEGWNENQNNLGDDGWN